MSVDMSPAQNAVLELKLAAIRHLGYDSFLVLLGETADSYQRRSAVHVHGVVYSGTSLVPTALANTVCPD